MPSLHDLARHVARFTILVANCPLHLPSLPPSPLLSDQFSILPSISSTSISAMHSVSGSITSSSSNEKLVCSVDTADRMVKIELEAAEALAGLAQVATRESSESGTSKWGSKGKRAAASRVKSESPSPDIGLHSTKKQATVEYDLVEEMDACTRSKKAKDKQETTFVSPSTVCDASTMSYGGCRSRKNLTEAEKEEKRLRRVLANRESARQTIRRRQVR